MEKRCPEMFESPEGATVLPQLRTKPMSPRLTRLSRSEEPSSASSRSVAVRVRGAWCVDAAGGASAERAARACTAPPPGSAESNVACSSAGVGLSGTSNSSSPSSDSPEGAQTTGLSPKRPDATVPSFDGLFRR